GRAARQARRPRRQGIQAGRAPGAASAPWARGVVPAVRAARAIRARGGADRGSCRGRAPRGPAAPPPGGAAAPGLGASRGHATAQDTDPADLVTTGSGVGVLDDADADEPDYT